MQNSVWNVCTIVNLDQPGHQVEAYFNPKEISVDKTIPWTPHDSARGDMPDLEFTKANPKTLKVELFFDCYEDKVDVYKAHVGGLEVLTQVVPNSRGKERHPPAVKVIWGNKSFLDFVGVVTALATKYTMFLPDGTPVRATCTITVQQIPKARSKVPTPRGPYSAGRYLSTTLSRRG